MKDRTPKYPNRIKLIPVAGLANTYDVVRADEATQNGTPLNKATLLSDSVAQALGIDTLPDGGTVNDALSKLNEIKADKSDYTRSFIREGFPEDDVGKSGDVWVDLVSKDCFIKVGGNWVYLTTPKSKTLEQCSWSEIKQIGQSGLASSYFSLGETKTFTVPSGTYTATLVSFNHDTVANPTAYGRTKAAMTFLFKARLQMASSGAFTKWSTSKARDTLLTFFNGIVTGSEANVLYDSIIHSVKVTAISDTQTETTEAKLFVPSFIELTKNPTGAMFGSVNPLRVDDIIPMYASEGSPYSSVTNELATGFTRSLTKKSGWGEADMRYYIYKQQANQVLSISRGADVPNYVDTEHKQTIAYSTTVGFCI